MIEETAAIQQEKLGSLLRRLPPNAPDHPVYLDKLSNMRAAEFKITKSATALDQAVELGLKVKNEALSMGFSDHKKDIYFDILNNLGCSLSSRFHFHDLHRHEDLDDAISTGRELITTAPENSRFYAIGLNNLTDRLQHRYKLRHDVADLEEALRHLMITNEQGNLPTVIRLTVPACNIPLINSNATYPRNRRAQGKKKPH